MRPLGLLVATVALAGALLVLGPAGHRSASAALPGANGQIVFTRDFAIAIADADGQQERQLTTGSCDTSPAWSPDGRSIAFARSSDCSKDSIFVMDGNGGGLRKITDRGEHPSWSPDAMRIAFSRPHTPGHYLQIYTMDTTGHQFRRLTSTRARNNVGPDWSPDGTKIAFSITTFSTKRFGAPVYVGDIYVMNTDGSGKRRLTTNKSFGLHDGSLSWSPDGTKIAFERDRLLGGRKIDQGIYVMQADGSSLRRLSKRRAQDSSPTWSPDGTKIAFVRGPFDEQAFVMDPNGQNAKPLIARNAYRDPFESLDWQREPAR